MPAFAPSVRPEEPVGAKLTIAVDVEDVIGVTDVGDRVDAEDVLELELDVVETKSVLWYRIETP
jgi:hypothetical protein